MNQKQSRRKIELLKNDLRATLEHDALKYKRAVIRQIDALWREHKNKYGDIDRFADFVLNNLGAPKANKFEIISELKATQLEIGEVWNDYYSSLEGSSTSLGVDYEKMIAAYAVDFPEIEKTTRDFVVKTVRESAKNNHGFETMRAGLQKTALGSDRVYTLANTATAQFDNASMFEFAKQAGVGRYLYDGYLQPNSRPFCVRHFKKTYTLEQINGLDNGQGLPVFTSCGGYNCTHFWTAIVG